MSNFDGNDAACVPPVFKIRNPDEDAVEGNYEWESDPIDCGAALQIAADHLGPMTSADVLARHWVHSGRADNLTTMAKHLLALHRRLT